jgi:thiamine transport system permease protein
MRIFGLSFLPEGRWEPWRLQKLVTDSYYVRILWFTFWQATVSTLLTLILALPAAYVFSHYRFAGRRLLQAFATIPFVLPTVVVAAAIQALLGPNGLINNGLVRLFDLSQPPITTPHSIGFILLAHVFLNYTVMLRLIGGYWSRLDPAIAEASTVLGATPLQVLFRVTFPLLRPAILAASLLVFIFCFSSFGVVLILGGPRLATIEVEIYRQAVYLFNLPMAGALSLIQIVFVLAMMWVYTRLQRQTAAAMDPVAADRNRRPVVGTGDRLIVAGNVVLMAMLIGVPLAALVLRSLTTDNGWTFQFYRALFQNPVQSIFFVPPFEAILWSCGFALVTLGFSLTIGLCAAQFLARSKGLLGAVLDPVFMLPLSTSAVTLGFGFIIALDRPPLNLRTSLLLVPLAHTLVAFPFVVRSVLPALRSIPPSLRESAMVLGARPWKVWRSIDLPIIGRALVVGAVFAFTVSLGEFGATVFVARPQTPTMPLAIYRFLGQPGALNYGQAMAMSSILMLVTAAGFLSLERIRSDRIGEF